MKNKKLLYFSRKIWKQVFERQKHRNVRDHCHSTEEDRGAAHSIFNLKYSVPRKIPIVFHNGSNYNYHFIVKELPKELKKQFIYLGENTEKYISFTVPVGKKVTRIDKNGE